ncbi:unnamed protein product [Adineta steineri]|uniref:Uncharacterized protein n=1 Tax=Adineta steineri TaxID=433720 RepID=A0A814EDL2_9BILA|nr:unnamed protein product [Adineta steineri]CAF3541812.1 unnamed protein product [Adineta steineri]
MSSITIICIQLIILISKISFIHQAIAVNQCDFSSSIYLQAATYTHSLVLRVQPLHLLDQDYNINNTIIRKVLVREVIKIPTNNNNHHHHIKMNDIIIIRINDNDDEFLDNSCWHLLRISTVDVILFLNETNTNEFDLHYPPVESTLRVRENIDAVLNHETYPPQVLIKTRIDKAILSKDYSLQCNSRGNPLPRLLWSKKLDINETFEYYPLSKQCQPSCRIYSVQHKYQSTLFFQSLTLDDIGTYVCHAENPMNRTTTSVYLDIDHHNQLNRNLTCSSLKDCHNRGQCIIIKNQLKCLCDKQYFGEQCETNYDDLIKNQDSAILLFKSRFLAGFILALIGFFLLSIALLSWFLAKNNEQKRKKLPDKISVEKPLITPPITEKISSTETNGIIPAPSSIDQKHKQSPPPPSPAPVTATHISHSPMIDRKSITPPLIQRPFIQKTVTRESSTGTEDDDEDNLTNYLRHYQTLPPVPTTIDEEYEERFSFKMNKSEELGLGSLMNGTNDINNRVISQGHVELYQPDNQTGLIKPLNIGKDQPQRYTKYVSSYSKFVLPRPVKSSSLSEYQQR